MVHQCLYSVPSPCFFSPLLFTENIYRSPRYHKNEVGEWSDLYLRKTSEITDKTHGLDLLLLHKWVPCMCAIIQVSAWSRRRRTETLRRAAIDLLPSEVIPLTVPIDSSLHQNSRIHHQNSRPRVAVLPRPSQLKPRRRSSKGGGENSSWNIKNKDFGRREGMQRNMFLAIWSSWREMRIEKTEVESVLAIRRKRSSLGVCMGSWMAVEIEEETTKPS